MQWSLRVCFFLSFFLFFFPFSENSCVLRLEIVKPKIREMRGTAESEVHIIQFVLICFGVI